MTHDGKVYKANWWTRNQVPGDPWGLWEEQGSNAGAYLTWTASQVYNTADIVSHNGSLFRAKWWTRNQVPGGSRGAVGGVVAAADVGAGHLPAVEFRTA